jgi:hypothetical protein
MMKTIALLILTVIAVSTHSQQPAFGIFAGPQVTTAKYSVRGIKQPTETKYGFHLGGMLKVPFEGKLYFAPAAFYSLKGYKVTLNEKAFPPDTTANDNNTTLHTFELAALLQIDLGKNPSHLFIRLGPSIDIQLAGKEKFNTKNGTAVNRSMKFGFDNYGYFGANVLLQFGYEMKQGISIAALYGHGIGSINNADYGPSIRHRAYGLTLCKYLTPRKPAIDTRNTQ